MTVQDIDATMSVAEIMERLRPVYPSFSRRQVMLLAKVMKLSCFRSEDFMLAIVFARFAGSHLKPIQVTPELIQDFSIHLFALLKEQTFLKEFHAMLREEDKREVH